MARLTNDLYASHDPMTRPQPPHETGASSMIVFGAATETAPQTQESNRPIAEFSTIGLSAAVRGTNLSKIGASWA
jgi:hypothetical protein